MGFWNKVKKWAPAAGAGLGYLVGGPTGAFIGLAGGGLLSGGSKSGKDKQYQTSGWTPEQQQMARLMLTQATGDVPLYSQMRRQTYGSLADLVGQIQPDLQAQVINPMEQQYQTQRAELNAQMGPNYWASSRAKTLADFDSNYNIQRAKSVADLLMQARQLQMAGYGTLLEQDPTRMYMQMLGTTPVETAIIPGQKPDLLSRLTGGLI